MGLAGIGCCFARFFGFGCRFNFCVVFWLMCPLYLFAALLMAYVVGVSIALVVFVRGRCMEVDYSRCSNCFLRRACWAIGMYRLIPPMRLRDVEGLERCVRGLRVVVVVGFVIVLVISFA